MKKNNLWHCNPSTNYIFSRRDNYVLLSRKDSAIYFKSATKNSSRCRIAASK